MSLVNVSLSGVSSPSRRIVRIILLPGSPRINLTESFKVMPFTGLSSSLTIRSPVFIPAFCAGVSSIGETTFIKPFSIVTSIPRPPNCPVVPSFNS